MPATLRRWKERLWELKQRLWPNPLYQAAAEAHRGVTESKLDTLSRYDFALCYENMTLEGWITEKLFDCLFAGTVPVYWGAPDIEERVPPECFIDVRRFDGHGDLRDHLHGLNESDLQSYREAGRTFVRSDAFHPFRTRTFVDRLDRIVAEDVARGTA